MSTAAAIKMEPHSDNRIHARRYEGIVRPYAKADVERLQRSAADPRPDAVIDQRPDPVV